mgnify:FL=1
MDKVIARTILENIKLDKANMEYRFELPAGTQAITVKLRETDDLIQVALVTGDETTYANLAKEFPEFSQDVRSGELFFRSQKGGKTVEVLIKI